MKQEQNDIKPYTARDIQQYLEGRLSSAEMHAIEKAALDDPFLADAIEGYAVTEKDEQNKDLQTLRIDLEKRIKNEKKKSTVFPIWVRAAVVVLAVLVGGLTIYSLFNANTETQNEPIAKNETVGPATLDTITANTQPKTDSQNVAQVETNLTRREDDKVVADKPVGASKKEGIPRSLPAPVSAEQQTVASAPVKDQDLDRKAAKSSAADKETEVKEDVSSFQQDKALNAFSGKVLDNNYKPVAGATILAKNRKVSTVTDMNGLFNISSPDTALNIEVNSIGYQQNNATLRNNNKLSNNIILQESNAALDEVVVVGYGAQSKKELRMQKRDSARMKVIADEEAVEPLGGWDEYDSYIFSNKRKPSKLESIDGEVILSFEVNEKHEISNIKIVKSLSQDLDKEAIRLVKEGPQWKTKKGKRAKAKLAIKF